MAQDNNFNHNIMLSNSDTGKSKFANYSQSKLLTFMVKAREDSKLVTNFKRKRSITTHITAVIHNVLGFKIIPIDRAEC